MPDDLRTDRTRQHLRPITALRQALRARSRHTGCHGGWITISAPPARAVRTTTG
jgi:hypothetical protein